MSTTMWGGKPLRFLACLALVLLFAIQLGSQSGNGTVTIATVPSWGQDGNVGGYVYGTTTNQVNLYLFEFIPDVGWYSISSCSAVTVDSTGQFSTSATSGIMGRYATRFTAYLVPATLPVPCVQASATIPFIFQQNALSVSTVPRLPQYSTFSFGGLTWFVKTAPIPVYPGPQFFVQQNAFVDNQGQLHLRLTQCGGSWCAADVYTTQTIGYGTYTFAINSTLNNLDPNVTLGLFTWDAQAGNQNNRELDIEFGRWGNPNATANAQFVVQPYNGPNNIQTFLMSPATSSTHQITWLPTGVQFQSSANSEIISQWNYPAGGPVPVPTPGDVHLHMTFYVAVGQAPVAPVNQEIIVSNFQYSPSGPQIGFSETSDSPPFLASTRTVPISASGAGCSATIESDSPWITINGPNPVTAGGSLQYSVGDNIGVARTGNLILQSTNCNASLGSQVLSVSQAGFVCSPTFSQPSTSIGFLQSVRAVLIQGTASACSWTVTSSAPWITIVSSPSGSGNGSIQFSADANTNPQLRQAYLSLNNGQQHWVYQDASGSMLALSPLAASPCGGQPPQFGVSWVSPSPVEIYLTSPNGQLVGQFGSSGSTLLPQIGDGTPIYLISPPGTSQVVASALASLLPPNCAGQQVSPLGIVNAASYKSISMASGSLATVFGTNLSSTTAQASLTPYPTMLGGLTVSLSGEACPLFYVSPTQVNFLVPSDLPPGRYLLSVGSATADALVTNVSPGIFTLNGNGTGVPLASLVANKSDGSTVVLAPYQCNGTGCAEVPMVLPPNLTSLYIVLYGTGIRNAHFVAAALGPMYPQATYFGAQSQYFGLDQVNLVLNNPSGLTGHQSLILQADGVFSNVVDLLFQ